MAKSFFLSVFWVVSVLPALSFAKNGSLRPRPLPKKLQFQMSMDHKLQKSLAEKIERTMGRYTLKKVPTPFVRVHGMILGDSYYGSQQQVVIVTNTYTMKLKTGTLYSRPDNSFLYYGKKKGSPLPITVYFAKMPLRHVSQIVETLFAEKPTTQKKRKRNVASSEMVHLDRFSDLEDGRDSSLLVETFFRSFDGCGSAFTSLYHSLIGTPFQTTVSNQLHPAHSYDYARDQVRYYANNLLPLMRDFLKSSGRHIANFPNWPIENQYAAFCSLLTPSLAKYYIPKVTAGAAKAMDGATQKIYNYVAGGSKVVNARFVGRPTAANLRARDFPFTRNMTLSQAQGWLSDSANRMVAGQWWVFNQSFKFHHEPFSVRQHAVRSGSGSSQKIDGAEIISETGTHMGTLRIQMAIGQPRIEITYLPLPIYRNAASLPTYVEQQFQKALAEAREQTDNIKYIPEGFITHVPLPNSVLAITRDIPSPVNPQSAVADGGGGRFLMRLSKDFDHVFFQNLIGRQETARQQSLAGSVRVQVPPMPKRPPKRGDDADDDAVLTEP